MTADGFIAMGFVILSHEGADKLARLVRALRREYPGCAIAIHHDFSQHTLDRAAVGEDIFWVDDWLRTGWAKWAVVEGALRAFRMLHERTDAEWFFLLSASDYPIRKGAEVAEELGAAQCDAFLDARPLTAGTTARATFVGDPNPQLDRFDAETTRELKRRFYVSQQLWLPVIRTKPKLRLGKRTWRLPVEGRHPFRGGYGCFYGDHWFTANRRAIGAVIEASPQNKRLRSYFRNRTQPDESFYATILANTPGLTICRDNRRFAEWRGGTSGPISLTREQLPAILASNGFFARKFDAGAPVLDDIDALLIAGS